jgi:hypothetical protein
MAKKFPKILESGACSPPNRLKTAAAASDPMAKVGAMITPLVFLQSRTESGQARDGDDNIDLRELKAAAILKVSQWLLPDPHAGWPVLLRIGRKRMTRRTAALSNEKRLETIRAPDLWLCLGRGSAAEQ